MQPDDKDPQRNTCPKCGFPQPGPGPVCVRCGIVFEKYRQRRLPGDLDQRSKASAAANRETYSTLREILFLSGAAEGSPVFWCRTTLFAVLLVWGGHLVFAGFAHNASGKSLLHLVNLPFHEAGHVVFRPFGHLVATLGGSLGQLLVPLVCLLTLLLKTRDPFGSAACLWWFGENFLDLAPYINDSRAGVLPLIGGNFGRSAPYGFHDWEFILTETGLLRQDHILAWVAQGLGASIMGIALFWACVLLVRDYKRVKSVGSGQLKSFTGQEERK